MVDIKRNTGLDFMRVVCMFMIISLHYFGEGGVLNNSGASHINALFGSFIVVLFRGAVDCFFMNSGYFLNPSNQNIAFPDSFRSVITLYKKVWFYSVVVFLIAIAVGISSFSVGSLFRALFPLMGNQYWYITVFILIALLRPFLARATCNMKDSELKIFIVILLSYNSIQATLGVNILNEQGNGFLHALTMVMLGYALQRGVVPVVNKKKAILIYVVITVTLRGSGIIIGKIPDCPISYWENLMVYNSPFVILIAYAVFCFFVNTNVKCNIFSKISGSVLVAYLIQDHSMMRSNFWIKVMKCDWFYSSNYMVLHWFVAVFLIVAVSICIDMLIQTVVKNIKPLANKKSRLK